MFRLCSQLYKAPNIHHCYHTFSTSTKPGLIIDIDGVLTRGSKVLECAKNGIQKLTEESNFVYPVVFLTNGSSSSKSEKAEFLKDLLKVNIKSDQVVLVNTPLKQFTSWHQKSIFFAGQPLGLREMTKNLGFMHPVFLEDFQRDLPMFDVIDHRKRSNLAHGTLPLHLPSYVPIDGIIIANTPVNWEAHAQLILDLLATHGNLKNIQSEPQLPLIACNPDFTWAAEYHLPRIACGSFVFMLSAIYQELVGKKLEIQWCGKPTKLTYDYAKAKLYDQAEALSCDISDIYGIGDNVDVDVVGANDNGMHSVLVCTGIYKNDEILLKQKKLINSKISSVKSMITADFVVRDIEIFINHILEEQ